MFSPKYLNQMYCYLMQFNFNLSEDTLVFNEKASQTGVLNNDYL